jgi:hypothetical protein
MKIQRMLTHLAFACLTMASIFWSGGAIGTCDAAIIQPQAPAGGRQIVYENVERILRGDSGFLGGSHVEDLTIAEPCREYFVAVTNLASGKLLSTAKAGGWRYPLLQGSNVVGVAILIDDEKTGKAIGFNSLAKPLLPNAPQEAVQQANKLPQTKQHDYELRYLGIPGVNFMAIWLHGKTDDIIIPLPPTFGRMNDDQPYSERQVVKILQKDAKAVMKQPRLIR